METWEKVAVAGGIGFLAFSLLPIWRSGRNGGQTFWGFLYHHSRFSRSDALWLKPEELNVIRELAEMGPEERCELMRRVESGH